MPERTCCLWCPDWPVVALRREDPDLHDRPVAVLEPGGARSRATVRAASVEARATGVEPGLRRREAEARCVELVVAEADPVAEARAFEAVARAVETLTPRVELERPGLLSFPTRGPSRYLGGDGALAERVRAVVAGAGVPDARVGVADGPFTARLAARRSCVVPPGGSAAFLAPWPVDVLGAPGLADLLVRLGLPRLGDFAALPGPAVLARFGADGWRAHRRAAGLDDRLLALSVPPPDLVEDLELDPPATRVEAAAFAAKALADRLLDRLEARGLACTRVVIEAETEHGERVARCWRHEGALTPAALAERARWQLEGWLAGTRAGPIRVGVEPAEETAAGTTGGLIRLRLVPDEVVPASGRQLGFWGGDQAAADRAGRALARVQGMLGHESVATPVPRGGRTPEERVRWVSWGEPRPARPEDAEDGPGGEVPPWPGAVPAPAPARVFPAPLPAELLDGDGRPVTVTGRGEPSASPAALRCPRLPGGGGEVTAWAGPWPHDLRWWDPQARRRRVLWQVVAAGVPCLVAVEGSRAGVEAVWD